MRNFVIIGILLVIMLGSSSAYLYKKLSAMCIRPVSERYNQRIKKYEKYLKKNHNILAISLNTQDNINLSALLIQRPQSKRVIAIFHGYRQAKEFLYSWVDLFKEDTILLVDLRAHGQSRGDIISFGYNESKDVHAAAQFLQTYDSTKKLPLYAIGVSMGSAALLKAAQEGANFKAIVLDSGFSCLKTQLKFSFGKRSGLPSWLFFIARLLFEWHIPGCIDVLKPYKLIEKLYIPVFIIHSDADKVVPVECATQLYEHANEPKKLWITQGPEHVHNHKIFPEIYKKEVLAFFDQVH